ncbi:hypothetical protein A7U60_g2205 [Sanghuangporus baumii]|uniref:Uncharacterized protein n=1 Tax=Sanghuangporus baumii TaxID=108892 RepID=A0A9Q5NAS4_SANBA|nr:hypothetical protein A7U60_g2205 [Sanghuangporus baumii]
MLPHRPWHSRHDIVDLGSVGSTVELDRFTSSTYSSTAVVHRSGSGDRLRSVTERPQLSLVSLPIPLLNTRNVRSMSAVPTKRTLSVEEDNSASAMDASHLGMGLGSASGSRKTNRLFAALRRSNSFSHKRSGKNSSGLGMFSTPEESSASVSPEGSRTASPARTTQPPSIAQIAMGLHTSRTPHLGPSHGFLIASEPGAQRTVSAVYLHPHSNHGHPHTRGRASMSPPSSRPQSASSSTQVATPLRSSLKKDIQKAGSKVTGAGAGADASRSTSPSASASSVPSTPRSTLSRISLAVTKGTGGGRSRLDKFLGRGLGRGVKSSVGSLASLNSNSSEYELGTPRKAVRFVATVENPDTRVMTTTTGGNNRLHPPRT